MTKLSANSINTTLLQDGQAPGSIVPASMRTTVSSLVGLPSTTVSEASYTLLLTDDGTRVRLSSASTARTLTIPPHSSVAFDVDAMIVIFMAGAGVVTVAAGAGVTIHTTLTSLAMAQYQSIVLQQDSQDVWVAG